MFAATSSALTAIPTWDRIKPIVNAPVEAIEGGEDPGSLTGALSAKDLVFRYAADGPLVIGDSLSEDQKAEWDRKSRPATFSTAILGHLRLDTMAKIAR